MTLTQAIARATARANDTGRTWLAIERTDHPHVVGSYFYAIAAADKRLWKPGERALVIALGA